MGCVNTTTKRSPQDDHAPQELQAGSSWKIKCLEPKNSKTIGNENMQTHDSLAEDHSVEIPGLHTFSPCTQSRSIEKIEVKKRKHQKIKHENSILSTGKLSKQFLATKQKFVQTTSPKEESEAGLNQGSISNKNCKNDYGQIDQFQEFQQKVQKIKPDYVTETVKTQPENQGNAKKSLNHFHLYTENQFQIQLKSGQNSAPCRRNKKRAKKPGFRSPRGRSCNLFKTFEDDYIEEEEDVPKIKKEESMSIGKISN